jgi:hypothetical protein
MTTPRKYSSPPLIFALLAVVLFSPTVATIRHVVPTAKPSYITRDHQLRRELTRVEREIVKSGAVIENASAVIDPPREATQVPLFLAAAVAYFTNSLFPEATIDPNTFTSDLSPVLNL